MVPVIHDAVTFRHLAAVNRMDVLQACHDHRLEPRWTEGVRSEIDSAGQLCRPVHRGTRGSDYFDQ